MTQPNSWAEPNYWASICTAHRSSFPESRAKNLGPWYPLSADMSLKISKMTTYSRFSVELKQGLPNEKKKHLIMLGDWSARSVGFGDPFQRTSAERSMEVACPKTAPTQSSLVQIQRGKGQKFPIFSVKYPNLRYFLKWTSQRLSQIYGFKWLFEQNSPHFFF